MIGVRTAPPTIAITSSELASLVFTPSPRMPCAKIVGNKSDMKKLVSINAPTPIQPGNAIPTTARPVLMTQYMPINLLG